MSGKKRGEKTGTERRFVVRYKEDCRVPAVIRRQVMENRKSIRVAAAVFCENGRILATQRGYGKYKDWWEFPGGKIEPGETPEEALVREIREELACEIRIESFLMTAEYDYPDFHLSMDCFICHEAGGRMTFLEHEAARWVAPEEFADLRWLPADKEVLEAMAVRLDSSRGTPGENQ